LFLTGTICEGGSSGIDNQQPCARVVDLPRKFVGTEPDVERDERSTKSQCGMEQERYLGTVVKQHGDAISARNTPSRKHSCGVRRGCIEFCVAPRSTVGHE